MRKIRIAQIGINLNSHGGEVFETLKSLPDVFEVVGYTLVENEREECAHKLKVFDGYKELTLDEILNDPTIEAVTVETDEIHLTKYTMMAVEHGKHVHMEKPGSQSVEDFEKLIDAVKKGGKAFSTGYMYRFNPFIVDAIERAKSGNLGKVFHVDAQMSVLHDMPLRAWQKTFKGGMAFYLGCHLIDLVVLLLGKPTKIIPLNRPADSLENDAEDFCMIVMEFASGAIATIKTCGAEVGGHPRRRLAVCGTKTTIDICPLEYFEEGVVYPDMKCDKMEYTGRANGTKSTTPVFHRYRDMLLAFGEFARGERENPFTPDYELELYKIVMQCCGFEIKE